MRIPSIEELKLQITDRRTLASIDEVLSCFYSGNLRSAVVMLYVTVISDLYFKLCYLDDIYGDTAAQSIRKKIETEWENHPNSPSWETQIFDQCKSQNKILTSTSRTHIEKLQSERHLCAHPTIVDSERLYHPNAANVQGLIIDMLREVLCRPAFLGKQFFVAFTNDIAEHIDSFATLQELTNYVEAKYLSRINNKFEEYQLFKKLWPLVFRLEDERAESYREASYSVLSRLFERNQAFILSKFHEDADDYMHITIKNESCLEAFVKFSNEYRGVYQAMPNEFKQMLINELSSKKNIKAIAFCTSDNPIQHYQQHINDISIASAKYIYNFLKKSESESIAIDFIIELYGTSSSFNRSDECFEEFIDPMLAQMSESQILEVIRLSNKNNQIYGRNKFSKSKNKIKEAMNKFDPNFDYSPYNHFRS